MKPRVHLVALGFLSFLGLAAAHAASEFETEPSLVPEKNGFSAMRAHRIDEPVFGGKAMVYEIGKEHARTIVLVHGIGDDGARDYREQIPWLARSWHVIAVDLPGFGRSDKANLMYSPKNYAEFLKVVTDRFVHQPFVLVGHSAGAVISLRYAARYPNDVARLVVIDAPGILHRYAFTSHYLDQFGLGFLPAPLDQLGALADLMRKVLGNTEQHVRGWEPVLESRRLRQDMLGGDPAKIAGLAVALEDLSTDIPRMQVETLIVWGRQDLVAPLRTGRLLARMLPRAQLAVIDAAGHEPMLQTPDRLRALLEPFLENGLNPASGAVVKEAPEKIENHGAVRCERGRNRLYEGEYDSIYLGGCDGAKIRNARVRELRIVNSSVTIEDSYIGGGKVGLEARRATVEMTGGRIEGEVAIEVSDSRLDLAGVEVDGREAAVKTREPSSVVFSICRLRSPLGGGPVHSYFALTKDKPL